MGISRIAGIALIGVGAAALVWGDELAPGWDPLEGGGTTVSEERRPIDPWAVVVGLVAGVTLMVIDTRARSGAPGRVPRISSLEVDT